MTQTAAPISNVATTRRAAARRPDPVDPQVFDRDVVEALDAFGTDVSYAVDMAAAAVALTTKRRNWRPMANSPTATQ